MKNKIKNHLNIEKNFQTIQTKKIDSVITLAVIKTTITAIKETTVIDLNPQIPDRSVGGPIFMIDPDPKIMDPETEPSIINSYFRKRLQK